MVGRARSDARLTLAKRHDLRFFASLQIIRDNIQRDRPILRGHRVSYLAYRSLPIDEVDDLVGIKRSPVLNAEQTVRFAIKQLDLPHALAPQPVQKYVVVLEGKWPKLGRAHWNPRRVRFPMPWRQLREVMSAVDRRSAVDPAIQHCRLGL